MPDIAIRSIEPAPRETHLGKGTLYCNYLWDSITVLSDGNVTCGFDDPFGRRSFGNIASASVREIFNGDGIRRLRSKLLAGKRCEGCHLHSRVDALGDADLPRIPEMPLRLILETTIRCNLRCRNTSCDLNNDRAFKVREAPFLSFDLYRKLMDEAGPHLGAMFFFNYGEPFLHPQAVDMLAYAKSVNPRLSIASSTNGIMLARGVGPRRIVAEGLLHYLNFTIAGCDDASYQKYHKGGSFAQALEGMRRVLEERRRLGRSLPTVSWRYLLFNWNDSDEQIERARAIAREIGVDELKFFLCSAPLEGRTRLRAPGTPGHAAIRDQVDAEVHYLPDPFADAGLYRPEHDRRLGAYAWSSRLATIELQPVRGSAVLHLARTEEVHAAGGAVRITTPWGTRKANVAVGEWAANVLELPKGVPDQPFAVSVETDDVFIPYRHGAADDYRELGVMISLACAEERGPSLPQLATVQAPAAAWQESEPVPLGALEHPVSIWVSNGEYALDDGPFSEAASIALPGQVMRLRHRSAAGPGLGTTTVATVGGEPIAFTSLTSPLAPWIEEEDACAPAEATGLRLEDLETPHAFVVRQYREILGREPDASGLQFWSTRLGADGDRVALVESFVGSDEIEAREARVARLYLACFPRRPDFEGLRCWIDCARRGYAIDRIAQVLVRRGEFRARYGAFADDEFYVQAWRALAGREPSLAETAAWKERRGGDARAAAMLQVSESAEFRAAQGANVFAALAYALVLERSPDVAGYEYWVDALQAGRRRDFIAAIVSSGEYAARVLAAGALRAAL